MFICQKPRHVLEDGAWELQYPDTEPAIVILDPRAVWIAMDRRIPGGFVPKPDKLERARNGIARGEGDFELPDIRALEFADGVYFGEGQHRTTVLRENGYTAYPVATTVVNGPLLLAKYAASVDEAKKHFDWSHITDYRLMVK